MIGYRLRWLILNQRSMRCGAHLIEPHSIDEDTPEGLYHNDDRYSTLEHRYLVHGGKFTDGSHDSRLDELDSIQGGIVD